MTFSDDDLKRLKEYTKKAKWVSFTHDDVWNLLSRLESAESYIYTLRNPDPQDSMSEQIAYTKWRRAKGEK